MTKIDTSEVINALAQLKDDEAIPKNVKTKIDSIVNGLQENTEANVKISNSLHILDEISEDMNIPAFIRTQVWNISSMLEKLNH